ncbi:MAG: hypothetical protein IJ281_07100 [Clostridia bacterium]|nr:hypothetical protein [Clostridia bacterium]
MNIGTLYFYKKSFNTSSVGVYHFLGVKKNSYAGSIVKRMYDYFCGGSNNLFAEYFMYYRKEFGSFEEFLVSKYNMFEGEAKKMASWRLFCKDLSSTPDTNIKDFLEHDDMREIIEKWLGDDRNED